MTALRSNEQAIRPMFYSCDLLFIIYLLFIFPALIFEAEQRRSVGPLPGCGNVV